MKRYNVLIFLLFAFATPSFSSTGEKEIRLHLVDSLSALADETNLYLDVGTSPAYLPDEDTRKEFDTVQAVPQVYTLTSDGVPCTSNVYGPFTQSEIIGVGIRVAGGSIYVFSAPLLEGFDPTSIILLEDRVTGVFHDMREGSYAVAIDQPQNGAGRFFIHVSYPPTIVILPAGCNNNGGAITVDQDSSVLWSSIQLFDSSNVYLSSYNNIKGDFNFSGLQEGNYNLAFVYGVYSAVKPVFINGSQIICSLGASTVNAVVGQQVVFNSNAQNATGYNWNFGDSTFVTGVANIDYSFDQPGTYDVTVQCTNGAGCSAYAYITISVVADPAGISSVTPEEARIYTDQGNLVITTGDAGFNRYEIYDISGQVIVSGSLSSTTSVLSIPGAASGIYIVRLKNPEGDLTRKIFLE